MKKPTIILTWMVQQKTYALFSPLFTPHLSLSYLCIFVRQGISIQEWIRTKSTQSATDSAFTEMISKKKKKKIRAVYHSSVYKDEKRKKMKKEWKKNWNNCTKSALTMIVICWNVSNRSRVGRKRRKMKYTSFLSRIIPIKKKQTKWNCVYFLLSFFNIWNKGLEMVCTPNFLAYSSDPGSNLFQSIKQ